MGQLSTELYQREQLVYYDCQFFVIGVFQTDLLYRQRYSLELVWHLIPRTLQFDNFSKACFASC